MPAWVPTASDQVQAVLGLPLEWWPQVGAGALVTLAVVMIYTGRLVPGRQVRDLQAALAKKDEALEVSQTHVTKLIEATMLTQNVLAALKKTAEGDSP